MSDIYVRRRGRRPSGMLLITFMLGVAVGFSSAYVLMAVKSGDTPEATPATLAQKPEPVPAPESTQEVAANTPAQAVEPPPPAPKEAEPVTAKTVPGPDDLWPGGFLFIAIEGTALDDATKALLKEIHPAGIVLRASNMIDGSQTSSLVADIKRETGFGDTMADLPLIAVEQEGGNLNPLKMDPAPTAAELGKNKDLKGAREYGKACAAAALSRGIGVLLSPVLDVAPIEIAPSAADARTYGTDQEQVALLGLAFADGISAGGAIPVAKIYPGAGAMRKIDNEERLILEFEVSRLAELMYPFDEAARQGIAGILAGHAAVPALDEQFPKRPASISPVLVRKVLRDHWNFPNVILADNMASAFIERSRPAERAVVEALMAGCDAALFLDARPDRVRAAANAILEAIEANTLSRDELAKSRNRLRQWQDRLRTTEIPAAPPPAQAAPVYAVPEMPLESKDTSVAPSGEKISHVVEKGETLEKIARRYGVKTKDLAAWNNLNGNVIKAGQKLAIYKGEAPSLPPPVADAAPAEETIEHLVLPGQTLQKIAVQYGTTVKKLLELNRMDKNDPLLADKTIRVPKPKE